MANIQDVANFFIEIGQDQAVRGAGDLVTPLQLEKLLYFAQGCHLARFGTPLFDDDFSAWQYGPVIPAMYHKYKPHGSNGIMRDAIPSAAEHLTSDEYDLLLDVAREYMRYSTSTLVRMSHAADSPWAQVYQPHTSKRILKEDIRRYFQSLKPIESFDDILDGYPEEDGE